MSSRLRVPRQIRVGALAEARPGARLRCAVLASTGTEWVGVDLASGALVRNRAGGTVPSPDWHRPLQVAEVVLGTPEEAPDPTRPEAVELSEAGEPIGRLRRRRARRLLRRLAAPERPGSPLLGRWGPSIAFEDLDGSSPSLVVVALHGGFELGRSPAGEARCAIHWSAVRQELPLVDPLAAGAAERIGSMAPAGRGVEAVLGFQPGFALVGLGAVRGGYAPKVVLSVLAR